MNVIDFFKSISATTQIPHSRFFWDENILGKKPETYFVYRCKSAETILNSDENSEFESKSFAVSIFTKTEKIDDYKKQIINAVLKINGKAFDDGFEDYEKETRYSHGEVTVTLYY
ncbi:MAG: hypothetical protein RR355_01785 [Oscillospiraceae bacterium]